MDLLRLLLSQTPAIIEAKETRISLASDVLSLQDEGIFVISLICCHKTTLDGFMNTFVAGAIRCLSVN